MLIAAQPNDPFIPSNNCESAAFAFIALWLACYGLKALQKPTKNQERKKKTTRMDASNVA